MPSNYPFSFDVFTLKIDDVHDVMADDVNRLQSSVVALQGAVGINPAANEGTVALRLDKIESSVGDLSFVHHPMSWLPDVVIMAINESLTDQLINPNRIDSFSATKITTGSLAKTLMIDNVISAINEAPGLIHASRLDVDIDLTGLDTHFENIYASIAEINQLKASRIEVDLLGANIINAINISTETATIHQAKIGNLDADKITAGNISANRLSTNVISAINAHIHGAVIDAARIDNLHATKITAGSIATDRLSANVIDAVNAHIGSALISQARIGNLDASKITSGTIHTNILRGNIVEAINLSTESATINQARISALTAEHITSGQIHTDRLTANVIRAINLTTGQARIGTAFIDDIHADKITAGNISANRLQSSVIEAVNIHAGGATINEARIANLNASKITAGNIATERLTANIVQAINARIGTVTIDSGIIGDLAASKITSGTISTHLLLGSVIEAINLRTDNAVINSAKIADLNASKITAGQIRTELLTANVIEAINARIDHAQIDEAKISNLSANKITSGDIHTDRLNANVINAINASISVATINEARIGNLSASKITSGTIRTDILTSNVIEAVNISAGDAVISAAKISNLDASKITSGQIRTDILSANVVESINARIAGTAVIHSAQIDNLDAAKITTGNITADRLIANVVTAINAVAQTATIDQAKIGNLDANKITAGNIATDRLRANVISAINLTSEVARIGTAAIADAAITTAKIQDATITTAKIQALAVNDAQIANLNATKINAGSIHTDRMSANVMKAVNASIDTARINGALIQHATITTAQIQDAAITAAKIGNAVINDAHINTLNADKITAGNISADRLMVNVIGSITEAVKQAHVQAGWFDGAWIGQATIDGASIRNLTVNTAHMIDASITNAKIHSLDAGKITTGSIATDRLIANVITAINADVQQARINGARIQTATIDTAHIMDAAITNAKIANLNASKLVGGSISADLLSATVIEAVQRATIANAFIEGAWIKQASITDAHIENINAGKITAGNISAERMRTFVIDAVNADFTGRVKMNGAVIANATIEGASIKAASIGSAHITEMSAGKITTGSLRADVMSTNVIDAVNITANFGQLEGAVIKNATITDAQIANINAGKITAGNIATDRLSTNIISAVNANVGLATINGAIIGNATITSAQIANAAIENAHIRNLDATKITTGNITADRMVTNVVTAINAIAQTATIDQAKIGNLDASKITTGSINANLMSTNIITAINANVDTATINQAKIGNINADKITGGEIDTRRVTITNNTGVGPRLDFNATGMSVVDADGSNILARLGNHGFDVYAPGGIKVSGTGTIRLGPNEDIVIASDGIRARAGGTGDYRAFFNADGMRFVEATNANRQLIMSAGRIALTTNGGLTASTAITPDGIFGQLLMDNTVPSSKFDTTPPAIPTWRNTGLTTEIEETAITTLINIVVQWNQVADTDLNGYMIYLREANSSMFDRVANVGRVNEYRIRGVLPSTDYSVMVSAYDMIGNESPLTGSTSPELTNFARIVRTPSDIISPAQPTEAPFVVLGLRSFSVRWNATTLNADNPATTCVDLSHYEVERTSSINWNQWIMIGNIRGTSFVDTNVQYEVEYSYRYRPVDTSDNKPNWSPASIAAMPLQVGSPDIIAHSISANHISVSGLDASVITSGRIHGRYIEAETITADKFQSTLHGDLTQAIRYVESILDQKLLDWTSTRTNLMSGTFTDTWVHGDMLTLRTVNSWNQHGLVWDTSLNWDFPVVTSGTWQSAIIDIGKIETLLTMPSIMTEGTGTITIQIRNSDDNVTWSNYQAFTSGLVMSYRYLQVLVTISVPNTNSQVGLRSLSIKCFVNKPNEFNHPFILLNAGTNTEGTANVDGGVQVKRGLQPPASIMWNEATNRWRAGVAGSEADIITGTGMIQHNNQWHSVAFEEVSRQGVANGYPALDNNGKIPLSQIPDVARQQTYVVNDPAARLLLTNLIIGDRCYETTTGDSFIWNNAWFLMADANWANVNLDWVNIINRPTSTTANIDNAVTIRHSHTNNAILDGITNVGSGQIITAAERTKLTGIADNANNYVHPATHPASMIQSLVANRALISTAGGVLSESTVTNIELAHLSGVTSNVQTQVNSKENTFAILPVTKGGTGHGSITTNRILYGNNTTALGNSDNLTWDDTTRRLLLRNGAGNHVGIRLERTGTDQHDWEIANETNEFLVRHSPNTGTYTDRFRIDSAGNVGIGAITPNFPLDVAGSVRIRNTNALRFGGSAAGDARFRLEYNQTEDSLDFVFSS